MDHRRFLQHFVSAERQLTGYLLAATGDYHEAEDLLQEVSVALWEGFDRYEEARPFLAWSLGIARHKVLDWRAQKGRAGRALSMDLLDAVAERAVEKSDLLADRRPILAHCVEALPSHLREAVELRYREGLRLSDLAIRLNRSVAALQMTFVRVRRALRGCVERRLHEAVGASR